MKQTLHARRRRHHVRIRVPAYVPAVVPSPGLTPCPCRSRSGRPVSRPSPLTPHASTAWADQAAQGRPNRSPGCRSSERHRLPTMRPSLPEGSRRHLNRCHDVRCICSTGVPKAGQWSGNCPDWLCKYGYPHTIVLQNSRLDVETLLAKVEAPLESPLWTSPTLRQAPKRLRPRLLHGRTADPAMQQVATGSCPLNIAMMIRFFSEFSRFLRDKNRVQIRLVSDLFHF